MFRWFCLCVIVLLPGLSKAATLYYYHQKPPYVVDAEAGTGSYFELLNALNRVAGGPEYQLRFMPRSRLERDLSAGKLDGAILGVNPIWFGDADRERFLWTRAIFNDRDLVVSARERPFEYGVDRLDGKTVCYVRGYFYDGITPMVKSGVLNLLAAGREDAIFHSLDQSRCHFGIISESLYVYLLKTGAIRPVYHIAQQPQAEFERLILVPAQQRALFQQLEQHLDLIN